MELPLNDRSAARSQSKSQSAYGMINLQCDDVAHTQDLLAVAPASATLRYNCPD